MKKLLNLKGAKLLSKIEQKSINGGSGPPELCDVINGVVYVCYTPYHCSSVFPFTCV